MEAPQGLEAGGCTDGLHLDLAVWVWKAPQVPNGGQLDNIVKILRTY